MREVGTRLSFLVVPLVLLAGGARWQDVAAVSAAQAAGYLLVNTKRPLGVYADAASVAVLAAMAYFHGDVLVVGGLAALLGALRSFPSPTQDQGTSDSPAREGLARVLLLAAGAVAGAAAMWLGSLGALWVVAMMFAVSAVLRPRPPDPPVEVPWGLTVGLVAATALTQAAAIVAVLVWLRDVTRVPELLGLVAAAFAIGMLGLGARHLIFALGLLAGGTTLFVLAGRPPVLLLVVAAGFVAGIATASVTPPVSRLAHVGAPVGTAAAAWALGKLTILIGLGAAAGLYLIALLIPVFAFRAWRRLLPDAPLLPVGPGRLPGRLTVTLVYTNGQWVVEVRRGRALLGSRHLVKSAEALNMLALLEVPGVQESVEKALTLDQVEAARQAERVRGELSELEAKLAGLNEMVELTAAPNTANNANHKSA